MCKNYDISWSLSPDPCSESFWCEWPFFLYQLPKWVSLVQKNKEPGNEPRFRFRTRYLSPRNFFSSCRNLLRTWTVMFSFASSSLLSSLTLLTSWLDSCDIEIAWRCLLFFKCDLFTLWREKELFQVFTTKVHLGSIAHRASIRGFLKTTVFYQTAWPESIDYRDD